MVIHRCLPDSPKHDSPKLGVGVGVRVRVSANLDRTVPLLGGVKEGWGVKIQRFSSFKRQYVEN